MKRDYISLHLFYRKGVFTMLKGNIFYTTDENLAMNSSFNKGYLVVALVDDSDTRFSQAQIRGIQYLLPPYMAFEAENLGDMDQFNKIYYNHRK